MDVLSYLSVECGPQAHPTVHCLLKYRPRRLLKCTVWDVVGEQGQRQAQLGVDRLLVEDDLEPLGGRLRLHESPGFGGVHSRLADRARSRGRVQAETG